ncbi:EI24 domain-containing protein [Alisedimentitalea sp. MJ-SS2]|uniref:EI24 domain-containing protein n=1 Tax=Aliisedimentitalea sp. MJ-SS2 TaxID=3049795 RepID=UPI00290C6D25|nr:EI24 domain-containing protein [Alisedimentitalea sp. MJ-SS2]MDU8927324.1 EI24 domain-containing protein [Alisedimentitalea sp. MJ-SS2]
MALDLILTSFLRAIGQIGDRRFRRVLWLGIALTIALLVAAYAALLWLVDYLAGPDAYLDVLGRVEWVGDLLSFSSAIFMLVLSFFLMIPVASAITSMFLDDVAQAVEDRHYPTLPSKPRVPFFDALRDTVSFLGILIAANTVAFVLYVFIPPASPFIFFGLNGFLLGREYFQLAAMRRIGREAARELRSQHLPTIWAAGVLMALPLVVPILNLVIPILGAATFTHIFHGLNRS